MFHPSLLQENKVVYTVIDDLPNMFNVLYDDDTTVILERNTSISVSLRKTEGSSVVNVLHRNGFTSEIDQCRSVAVR